MDLLKIYKNLYNYFGPQGWWPITQEFRNQNSEIRNNKNLKLFEICVGAILTQNTAWKNVEKALSNLNKSRLLTPQAIVKTRSAKLEKLIKPTGYFRQKSKKLKIFSKFLINNYGRDINKLFNKNLLAIRHELLAIWGIGPETADSMILYAGNKPSFVIDVYTKRMLELLKIRFKTYDEYKIFFEDNLLTNPRLFNEYHALIVAWGKLLNKDRAKALKLLR